MNAKTSEGSDAFTYEDPRNELVALVSTALLNDKFYESSRDTELRLHNLIDRCLETGHFEFLWKLFYVARTSWNLRSITHLIAGYLLSRESYNSMYPDNVDEILSLGWVRPDDMMETFSYYAMMNNNRENQSLMIPYNMRAGAQHRFKRMSYFHAGKYPGKGRRFSLRNIIRMVRPTPDNEEMNSLFRGIVEESVESVDTNWRARVDYLISTQNMEPKDAYEDVLSSMGTLGIVKNLNTFARHGVNEEHVLQRLRNRQAIERSRMLPFEFASAIKHVTTDVYVEALKQALEWTFDNLELPDGKNYLVAIDTSGSMGITYERKNDGYMGMFSRGGKNVDDPIETASLFGSVLARKAAIGGNNTVHLINFGNTIEAIEIADKDIWSLKEEITDDARRNRVGHSTNGYLIYQYANQPMTPDFDYVFILTDMQWSKHKFTEPSGDYLTVFVNIGGYNTTLVPHVIGDRRVELSGLSDKVFDYIETLETPQDIVNNIMTTSIH